MLEIDGSQGEGGGQILRSSLSLAVITGTPFRVLNVRAKRSKPGLRRQHLTAVRAAAEICGAQLRGDELHSREFYFTPGELKGGDYRFDIGTAGSTTLVLQTVLPPLLTAEEPSRVVLEGGTHNTGAPPFDFMHRALRPLLNRMGCDVALRLDRRGFYPAGGGRVVVEIEPTKSWRPLELLARGKQKAVTAKSIVANLPDHIAQRELSVIGRRLNIKPKQREAIVDTRARGPGNICFVEAEFENVTEVFTAFGEKGKPAERVARAVAKEAEAYLKSDVPVGEHLADQLLLPMSIGAGGRFVTGVPSLHTTTNIDVIRRFLDVEIDAVADGARSEISVARPADTDHQTK